MNFITLIELFEESVLCRGFRNPKHTHTHTHTLTHPVEEVMHGLAQVINAVIGLHGDSSLLIILTCTVLQSRHRTNKQQKHNEMSELLCSVHSVITDYSWVVEKEQVYNLVTSGRNF